MSTKFLLSVVTSDSVIAGVYMGNYSFGGSATTFIYSVFLFVLCTYGTYKSWTSIRRLEIDQHRVWTLRTWSYAGAVGFPPTPYCPFWLLTVEDFYPSTFPRRLLDNMFLLGP